jgi:Bacterial archaeo-eukaryotic release factor family 3
VDETRTFHTHPAAGGRADAREMIFHGQGVGIDNAKEGLLEFAQRVDRGLQGQLRNEQAPLVLAGVDYLLAIYRQAKTYPHLLAEGVEGHPDRLSARELHDRAWPVVEPHFRVAREKTAALYRQLAGTGRTASDLAQVVAAAYQGQIQFLFVALGQERWGRFDPVQQKVEIHERTEPGDEDLLNFAVVHTLSHKGTVYAIPPEELPDRPPLAAIFWLPLGERSSKRMV